jgi:hypothetical protein
LVVTATLWRVPDGVTHETLYERLGEVVTAAPADDDPRLWLADSKTVYSRAAGLECLELGVLALLRACRVRPTGFRELIELVARTEDGDEWNLPWHDDVCLALPHVCSRDELDRASERLAAGLTSAGVELAAVRSRCVFPAEFNATVKRMGNKATVLTAVTLGLIRGLLEEVAGDGVVAACDKHGGRNAYAAALQEFVADGLVQTVCESRASSRYRFQRGTVPVEIGFHVGCESRPAAALASMVSKYVREIAMLAWNNYWCGLIPDIRPTAGYPGDASRYRRDILSTARRRKLPERLWWRSR